LKDPAVFSESENEYIHMDRRIKWEMIYRQKQQCLK